MKKLFAILLVAALLLIAGLNAYKLKQIEKRGPEPATPVNIVVSLPIEDTSSIIKKTFNLWSEFLTQTPGSFHNHFPVASKWHDFYLFPKADPANPVFPPDERMLVDAIADPMMQRYLTIPAALRDFDFYLYEPTGDLYWPSEYFYLDETASFRCSFIGHLDPQDSSHTQIEVFEYQPQIWVGEKFAFSAHAILPGFIHDIRFVSSTTQDRQELLKLIENSILTALTDVALDPTPAPKPAPPPKRKPRTTRRHRR